MTLGTDGTITNCRERMRCSFEWHGVQKYTYIDIVVTSVRGPVVLQTEERFSDLSEYVTTNTYDPFPTSMPNDLGARDTSMPTPGISIDRCL